MPFWGTSFSAAYVSGVAALVRAKYPELTAHQVINRILQTAHNPPRGVDNQVGYGVVDPVAALTFNVPLATGLPRRADAGDHPGRTAAAPGPPCPQCGAGIRRRGGGRDPHGLANRAGRRAR
ncbi:subtilase family protein [Mycobacterium xenopi 4042]|uniref:Subtilase family protein n=1 Tax=Mycobacterium xenopi 4042 TaxID=1299334 RepID=X8CKW0_MYCXE|nr:subtilase family protein [Mycobacterium xenopi 4042]